MNRETYDRLVEFVGLQWPVSLGGRPPVSPRKMVAMTLVYLGSGVTSIQLSMEFNVTEDTFLRATQNVMEILRQKASLVIKWPTRAQYPQIAASFDQSGRL